MHKYFFPKKDTTIYSKPTLQTVNTGLDQILEIDKYVEAGTTASDSYSRILMQFDLAQISQSVASGKISSNAKYFLNLCTAKPYDLALDYTVEVHPITAAWANGTGLSAGEQKNDGATWLTIDGATTWSLSGSDFLPASSSQRFNYEDPDLHIDITNIASMWLSGSIPNYGLVIKRSSTDEVSTASLGHLSFYSIETHTVYLPTLEVAWDSSTYVTGSIPVVISGPTTASLQNGSFIGVTTSSLSGSFVGDYAKFIPQGLSGSFTGSVNTFMVANVSGAFTAAINGYVSGTFSNGVKMIITGSILGTMSAIATASMNGSVNFIATSSNAGTFSGSLLGSVNGTGDLSGSYTGSASGSMLGNVTASMSGSINTQLTGSISGAMNVIVTGSFIEAASSHASSLISGSITLITSGSIVGYISGSVIGNVIAFIIPASYLLETGSIASGSISGFYTGSITGSETGTYVGNVQTLITGSILQPLKLGYAASPDMFSISMKNLKPSYIYGSDIRFRLEAKEQYQRKTFYEKIKYTVINYLPPEFYYSISDAYTGRVMIPYSDYTKVSLDQTGHFFDMSLSGFMPERFYRITFRVLVDGIETFFDKNYIFKVVK